MASGPCARWRSKPHEGFAGQVVETQSGKQANPGSRNGFDDMDEGVVFANVCVGRV